MKRAEALKLIEDSMDRDMNIILEKIGEYIDQDYKRLHDRLEIAKQYLQEHLT